MKERPEGAARVLGGQDPSHSGRGGSVVAVVPEGPLLSTLARPRR